MHSLIPHSPQNHGITYKCEGIGLNDYDHHLIGYTDANYAGDVDDQKSMTGWINIYAGAPICWSSVWESVFLKKQFKKK